MKRHILCAHRILCEIYADGTYSNMALHSAGASDMAVRLVYGTLENNVRSEYVLSELLTRKPQRAIYILLKIGVYALENLTNVPKFAIVSECVEAAKAMGKSGASGFVNAVLKRASDGDYRLPDENDENFLSVTYSKPRWFVDKLISQYGREIAVGIISQRSDGLEHLRICGRISSLGDVTNRLQKAKQTFELSEVGGVRAGASPTVKHMFDAGLVTYQTASSMLAVNALAPRDGSEILDLCSAPGGKAVYMSELCPHSAVIAGELHPHRIKLIRQYMRRMHAQNIEAVQNDATVLNEDWIGKFDFVLVDAPCSCFGTFLKHPDVFLSRGEEDILSLQATQKSILQNAAQYVKSGGVLVYSTCTVFDEENGAVVGSLLDAGKFSLEHIAAFDGIEGGRYEDNKGSVQILPHAEYDGFYIARLRKA